MAARYVDDLFITEIRTPSEASFGDPDSALRNAHRFLKNLPQVELNELPADERDCEICQEAYGTDGKDKKIVQLPPCGHKFGRDCIYEWLTPTNIPNRNTCPKCRAVLFEIDHSGYSDEEIDDDDDDRAGYIPELCALLDLETMDSFDAALDFMAPFMQGNAEIPREFTYSRQIIALFRAFPRALASDEDPPSESMVRDTAAKLAALMGQLYARFHAEMDRFQVPFPWREAGPRVRDLLDREMHGMIMVGIYFFMDFEDVHGQRLRRNAHSD